MNNWPDNVDLDDEDQVRSLVAELNVSEMRLRRAVASVGTNMKPVSAYLYEEAIEFGPSADQAAACGKRSKAAEQVGVRWREMHGPKLD